MRTLLAITLLLLAGCIPHHQKGGGASASIPQQAPTTITIQQPENPEGPSGMKWEEITTTTAPDGTVVVTSRKIDTTVNGSQDLAKILKEYMGGEYFKKLLGALGCAIAAWVMYKKEWETVALIMLIAAVFCLFWSWLAAPIGVGASFLVAYAHFKTKLI